MQVTNAIVDLRASTLLRSKIHYSLQSSLYGSVTRAGAEVAATHGVLDVFLSSGVGLMVAQMTLPIEAYVQDRSSGRWRLLSRGVPLATGLPVRASLDVDRDTVCAFRPTAFS
jgi:hypothetical protein